MIKILDECHVRDRKTSGGQRVKSRIMPPMQAKVLRIFNPQFGEFTQRNENCI